MNKIKFIATAVKWFDKVNGNTYHSVQITRIDTGKTIYCPFQYGYENQYRNTALQAMSENNWIPERYKGNLWEYEKEKEAVK